MGKIMTAISPSNELKMRVKDARGKKALESKIRRSRKGKRAEVRYTRKPHGKAPLQIVWEEQENGTIHIVHLHCKKCGNEWKIESRKPLEQQFSISQDENNVLLIRCKNCGQIYQSG